MPACCHTITILKNILSWFAFGMFFFFSSSLPCFCQHSFIILCISAHSTTSHFQIGQYPHKNGEKTHSNRMRSIHRVCSLCIVSTKLNCINHTEELLFVYARIHEEQQMQSHIINNAEQNHIVEDIELQEYPCMYIHIVYLCDMAQQLNISECIFSTNQFNKVYSPDQMNAVHGHAIAWQWNKE